MRSGSNLPEAVKKLPEGDYVRLEVSDTGCGMTPETQRRAFDPFFTTKFAGRGMGLAMVQRIVRGLGGAIEIVSSPGNGCYYSRRTATSRGDGSDERRRRAAVLLPQGESETIDGDQHTDSGR